MRRRTKRRLLIGGAVAVVALGTFRVYGPKETRPMVQAFSNTWAMEDVAWTELFAKHALSLNLVMVQGTGEVQVTEQALSSFCASVLDALPALAKSAPGVEASKDDIYRINFNVKNKRSVLFDDDLSIVVDGGDCLTGDMKTTRRYPAPLTDWELRDPEAAVLAGGPVLEASFTWTRPDQVDLSAFAFEQACKALLIDPPLPFAAHLAKGAFEKITVWAEQRIGEAGSGQFTAATMTFDIADNICVKAEQ